LRQGPSLVALLRETTQPRAALQRKPPDQLREDESWDVINGNSRKRRREASRKSNSGIGKRG
jgi:hypothetical protein